MINGVGKHPKVDSSWPPMDDSINTAGNMQYVHRFGFGEDLFNPKIPKSKHADGIFRVKLSNPGF